MEVLIPCITSPFGTKQKVNDTICVDVNISDDEGITVKNGGQERKVSADKYLVYGTCLQHLVLQGQVLPHFWRHTGTPPHRGISVVLLLREEQDFWSPQGWTVPPVHTLNATPQKLPVQWDLGQIRKQGLSHWI